MKITKLHRDAKGHWRARLTGDDGVTHNVTRESGSWEALTKDGIKGVLYPAARKLEDKIRPIEKAERRGEEAHG